MTKMATSTQAGACQRAELKVQSFTRQPKEIGRRGWEMNPLLTVDLDQQSRRLA